MPSAAVSPEPGNFDAPETFTIADTRHAAVSRLLSPILLLPIVAGFLLWVLLSALFNVVGLPAPRLIALLVAVVVMAGLMAVWLKMTTASLANTWLRIDGQGMTFADGPITRTLAWPEMTSVGRVKPIRGVETSFGGSSARTGSAVAAGVNRTAQELSGSIGLLGVGQLIPQEGSSLAAALVQQNLGSWGQTEDARPLIGIAPEDVQSDWYAGRIGAWLRHHRPDLAAAYEQQSGQRPQ